MVIPGHLIYKSIWTVAVGQELIDKPEDRKEALDYEKFSIGVIKSKEKENKVKTSGDLVPVRHASIEISSLLYYFLKAVKDNAIHVQITGAQKREVGLIVLGKYSAKTKNPRTARILGEE